MTEDAFRDILAEYERIREKNSLIEDARKREVMEKLPEYKALTDEAAEEAASYGKKLIMDDTFSLHSLDETLDSIAKRKRALLLDAGYPADYLQPVFDCPDCRDTGFINSEKCHCLKQRIADALYRQSHIKDILQRENFNNSDMSVFSPSVLPDMEKVYAAAKKYVNGFALSPRNMLFLGNVGSGKTYLTNCIAKALLDKGFSVIYFSAFRLFELIADNTFRHSEADDSSGFFSNIYDSDLLIIDDLGTETVNSFVASQFFNILNEREIRRKSTIISSNLSLEKIKDIYSERSISRIIGNYELYYFRGEDLRMKT